MNIEEFVNDYLKKHLDDEFLYSHFGLIEFAKVFQEKLMEEAVEGRIAERAQGKLYARCQVPKTMKAEFGDKVRVIIIKMED